MNVKCLLTEAFYFYHGFPGVGCIEKIQWRLFPLGRLVQTVSP